MAAVRLVPYKHSLLSLLVAVGVSAGCDSPTGTVPPPPTTGPSVVCPSDIVMSSDSGAPLVVNFPTPSTSTDHPPVSVKCSPETDSQFPVGSNAVVCTAVDAVAQSSCSFKVTVSLPDRKLKFTKIMAFGDSTTQGFLREPPDFTTAIFRPQLLDPVVNYPYMLEQMLRQRYGSNEIVVINEGLGGETIEEGTERIVTAMATHQPQVVLLFEGYNHLTETSISSARSGLRAMARWAETHGAAVVLGTLFQVSDDREDSRPGSQAIIDDLNDAIRGLASSLGHGGVADLEQAFGTGVGLLGSDGLHPNQKGYQVVAGTFEGEIIRRFEEIPQPSAPAAPAGAGRGTHAASAARQSNRTSGH